MAQLTDFIAEAQREIIFANDIYGLEATYSRRVENADGSLVENLSKIITVSQQGTNQTVDNFDAEFGSRICIFWVKTADLYWENGNKIIPKTSDTISCLTDGEITKYCVGVPRGVKVPTQFGFATNFTYEDAGHTIMKIMTFKE